MRRVRNQSRLHLVAQLSLEAGFHVSRWTPDERAGERGGNSLLGRAGTGEARRGRRARAGGGEAATGR